MRECWINNIIYNVPENFNELTKEQLLFFIDNFYLKLPHFFMYIDEKEELVSNKLYYNLKIVQLWNLLRVDKKIFDSFSDEDIYFFLEEMNICDFLFEPSTLTKNHFLKLDNGLIGPVDDFNDFTAGEYIWSDYFYRNHKQQDANAINALIATLYRPHKKGRKELIDHTTIDKREVYIAKLPATIKIAILLFYEGCINQQHENYKEAFEGSSESSSTYNDLLLQVAKDGPFGNYNDVCRTNIHLINQEMVRLKREADALEQRLKQ